MKDKTFNVVIMEVHASTRAVQAATAEEALAKIVNGVEDGDELACEYSHTLDADTWTVEEAADPAN
jgi:hypothetical protein